VAAAVGHTVGQMSAEGSPDRSRLLPEIEGMRALAVLSVLLYHAHFGFSGGYVGVDVFFVVSGFLITGLLLREYESKGRISLREFYARRARRLLPAATLVLITTLVLSATLLDQVRANQTARDGLWAGGFIANFRFAKVGADYLQQALPPSPLQHWWSLAVEEQFYFVWPSLLVVLWAVFGRSRRVARIRASALVLIVGLGTASFVVGERLTTSNPSWGYFATWSRGWELAVGAACAFVWAYYERFRLMRFRAALGWMGIALIVYSALRFDGLTDFPGVAAWYPVGGTALVIFSIGTRWGPGLVLSLKPLQWIGGRSYGIYLWHWPLLIILEGRIEQPEVWQRACALAVAVAAAAVSFVLIENPIRYMPALSRSALKSVTVGVGLVAVSLVAAVVIDEATSDFGGSTGYVAPALTTAPPATTANGSDSSSPDTAAPDPSDSQAGTTPGTSPETTEVTTTVPPDPAVELATRVENELRPLIIASTANDLVPDNLRPELKKVSSNKPSIYNDGCLAVFNASRSPQCRFGAVGSATKIVLYGDSHAAQWFPGLELAAERNGWELDVLTKMGCPSVDIVVDRSEGDPYPECGRWRDRAVNRILESSAQLVIITNYRYQVDGRSIPLGTWSRALSRTVKALRDDGKQVLLLTTTPSARIDMQACLVSNRKNLSRCHRKRSESVKDNYIKMERDVAAELGVLAYDTTVWMCAEGMCPAVMGDVAVFLDTNHITRTFGEFLSPYLELIVKDALDTVPA